MKINENTNIGLPLRNLIGLIGAIVIGAWFAFGVIERLNKLETADILFKEDLLKRAEQEPKNLEIFMFQNSKPAVFKKLLSTIHPVPFSVYEIYS